MSKPLRWLLVEFALPSPGKKVLGWWRNWGGMIHVVHFDKPSWICTGKKVMAPSHWQYLPEPPLG